MLAITSVLFIGWYWLNNDIPALDALRIVTFSVVSVVTTTGFAVDDYTQWGGFAVMAFFYLTFVGVCSGSTSGGLKMFRFPVARSEEHTSELQSLMRISYAVFCLKKKKYKLQLYSTR